MSDLNATPPARSKPAVFKSKKELVALVVAASVFAVVIYLMYFRKKGPEVQVAELAEPAAVAVAPVDAAAPAPVVLGPSVQNVLASLSEETDAGADATAEPVRNPFQMTAAFRTVVYGVKAVPTVDKGPSKPVVLTPANARSVLSGIPGAQQAAAAGLVLDAVMITETWRGASINGEIIPLGETFLGFTLTDVAEDRVTLKRGKHRIQVLVRPPVGLHGPGGKRNRAWRLPK